MSAPANPVLHTPAHKQSDPAKKPGQVQPQNVWLSAVKQDKEKANANQ